MSAASLAAESLAVPVSLPPELATLLSSTDEPSRTAAWERFLKRYSLLLLHTASSLGGGQDRAMDRYLYMLDHLRRDDCRRLRRFQANGRSKFATWLVVVAKRLCLDEHRHAYGRVSPRASRLPAGGDSRLVRRRLADLVSDPATLATLADSSRPDAAAALDRLENSRLLHAELRALAPRDRELLRLRYEEGMRAREIAQRLDFPSAFQVYRRLNGVLELLRRRLTLAGMTSDAV